MNKPSLLKRTFSDPRVEKYQRRRTRRLLVTTLLMLDAALLTLALYSPHWYLLPLLLACFPLIGMINMSVRGMTELRADDLDERMLNLRNSVYRRVYYVGIVLTATAAYFGKYFIGSSLWSSMVYGGVCAGVLLGLPALTLSWQLPDEPPEEDV